MLYPLIRSALFTLDAERAHAATIALLAADPRPPRPTTSTRLATRVAGIAFANPLGVAAGFDKDGRAIGGLLRMGVGAVEIGTLTPLPQPGNPRPRLFRLVQDDGVINRIGFNNGGLDAGLARVAAWQTRRRSGCLGINVGANKDAANRVADYVVGVSRAAPLADYVTINVSSPNTPGLRDLQHGAALRDLLAACRAARGATPLFLKIAPDLDRAQIDDIVAAAIDAKIDALIIGNTTVSRPALASRHAGESGGLSGRPLAALARQRLTDVRAATGGQLPLIAVGGVESAEEAYARIRAGASLVQLYSAMVYGGPGLPRRILAGLDRLLARDGFANVSDAVG